jgi:hypothetical protein
MHTHVNDSNYLAVPIVFDVNQRVFCGCAVNGGCVVGVWWAVVVLCLSVQLPANESACLPYAMSAVSRKDPPEHYNAGRADAALIYRG